MFGGQYCGSMNSFAGAILILTLLSSPGHIVAPGGGLAPSDTSLALSPRVPRAATMMVYAPIPTSSPERNHTNPVPFFLGWGGCFLAMGTTQATRT